MSLDGINGRSIQTLLRGENDSKQSDEFQAIKCSHSTLLQDPLWSYNCKINSPNPPLPPFSYPIEFEIEIAMAKSGIDYFRTFLFLRTNTAKFGLHMRLILPFIVSFSNKETLDTFFISLGKSSK